MTNPSLSIETTAQIKRVYQRPFGTYPKKISSTVARKGLAAGELFPSITNIIGAMNPNLEGYVSYMFAHRLREDGLSWDSVDLGKVEYITHRDMAAARGTRVHKAIEDFIDAGFAEGNLEDVLAEGKYKKLESYQAMRAMHNQTGDLNHFRAFLKFLGDHKPRFIHQEATVYGHTEEGFGYAGTTDAIAEINGKIYVMDWKTSSKMSFTVAAQLAAVIFAEEITTDFETLNPVPHLDGARGIHLDKHGEYGIYKANVEEGWEMFKALRRAWDFYAFQGAWDKELPLIKKVG